MVRNFLKINELMVPGANTGTRKRALGLPGGVAQRGRACSSFANTSILSYQRANKETCRDLQTSKLAETCEGLVDVVPKGPQEMHGGRSLI